jgi:peroxiredoxin family protein
MADRPSTTRPDKLSLVVFSGDYARVHYALATAAAAVAVGIPVTLFFTMEALRALSAPAGGAEATDADYARRGLATFEELLSFCVEMEVRFLACEMGLKAIGLAREALRDDIPIEDGGLVTFLNDASATGGLMFI